MRTKYLLLIALAFFTFSCKEQTEAEILLHECLDAHGGIDNWNKFDGLSFEVMGEKDTVISFNQLKDRRSHLKSAAFEIGFDGTKFWTKGDTAMSQVKNPAFFHNLDFYFFAIPFVMADPGVQLELEEDAQIKGQNYRVLQASFGEQVGSAPNDVYKLYINPETKQLGWLEYSVTYFDSDNTKLSLKQYGEWQKVDGLLVPKKMANFAKDSLNQPSGEPYYNRDFKHVKFYADMDEQLLAEAE